MNSYSSFKFLRILRILRNIKSSILLRSLRSLISLNSLIALATLSLTFAACSQDGDPAARGGAPLQISVTAQGFSPSPSERGQGGEVETRAFDENYTTTFANNDKIGITVVANGGSGDILQDNIPYKFNGSTWEPDGGGTIRLADNARYLVYYPYVPSTMNGLKSATEIVNAFVVPDNQSDHDTGYTKADLMTGTGSVDGTSLTVSLVHKMAMVEVVLPSGASNAKLKVDAGSDITLWNVPTTTTWRGIVDPIGTANLSGTYTHNATTYLWEQPGANLTAGKYTKVNVTNVTVINVSRSGIAGGPGWTYSGNVFTITQPGTYIVIGTTTANRVEVAGGITAAITLNGVSITLSGDKSPFTILQSANVTVTLQNSNTLKKNNHEGAGLQINNATLTIGGNGSLEAQGGTSWPGIGGTNAGYTIIINSGTITAQGGIYGAGIGRSSYDSNNGTVTINGGTVNATGGQSSAGIGGGYLGGGGTVTINGGTVTATGGQNSAGIGGGQCAGGSTGGGGTVTINGGTVTARSDVRAFGGGNGSNNHGSLALPGSYTWWFNTANSEAGVTNGIYPSSAYSLDASHKWVKIQCN